jgi:hypothetical protein
MFTFTSDRRGFPYKNLKIFLKSAAPEITPRVICPEVSMDAPDETGNARTDVRGRQPLRIRRISILSNALHLYDSEEGEEPAPEYFNDFFIRSDASGESCGSQVSSTVLA